MTQFINGLRDRLASTFNLEAFGNRVAGLVEGAVTAAAVLLAYYVLWRALEWVSRPILRRAKADPTAIAFVQTVLKYGVLTIGVVHALGSAGINTAGILTSLGIAGLTIGFAARDALSNIISGILIFWDRPFVIGDLIEIEGKYGRVDKITLRSTRVVTTDGRMLAVPNTSVINSTVASYTNFPHLRLDVPITVGVGEDIGRIRALLLGIVAEDPSFMSEPAPRVVVTQLNDYNLEMQLQAWLDDERAHVTHRFALREKMFDTLRGAGIDLPYETFSVTPLEIRGSLTA